MRKKLNFAFIFLIITIILFTACKSKNIEKKDILSVVCTTTFVHDLCETVGGKNIEAVALMSPGINPHLYNASAGDVDKIQQADILVYNGLHLEGKMEELFENLSQNGKDIICLEAAISKSALIYADENTNIADPHIWFDVKLWQVAAKYLAEELSRLDPQNKASYLSNYEKYNEELKVLDTYINKHINLLCEQQRVLITAHDAFGYFGKAYGFEVLGLQGTNTNSEASTADISNLASFIAENKINAIFIESSVSPKTIEALQEAVLAKGFEVEIGGQLYSDSLGDESTGHDSYISTFKANIDTITTALK